MTATEELLVEKPQPGLRYEFRTSRSTAALANHETNEALSIYKYYITKYSVVFVDNILQIFM